ncbi:UNVERIFIED_CONTAM: hypothetical protein FKN15_037793 [Acipenser sinensis]
MCDVSSMSCVLCAKSCGMCAVCWESLQPEPQADKEVMKSINEAFRLPAPMDCPSAVYQGWGGWQSQLPPCLSLCAGWRCVPVVCLPAMAKQSHGEYQCYGTTVQTVALAGASNNNENRRRKKKRK